MTFHTSVKRRKITFNSYNYNFFFIHSYSVFLSMFSLKNAFPANNLFCAFRLRRAYVDVTITTFKNQNGGRSPIENKQLHFRD